MTHNLKFCQHVFGSNPNFSFIVTIVAFVYKKYDVSLDTAVSRRRNGRKNHINARGNNALLILEFHIFLMEEEEEAEAEL